MKFITYMEKISGVSIYGLISFGIFFLFFLLMLTLVLKADKKSIQAASRIPLD